MATGGGVWLAIGGVVAQPEFVAVARARRAPVVQVDVGVAAQVDDATRKSSWLGMACSSDRRAQRLPEMDRVTPSRPAPRPAVDPDRDRDGTARPLQCLSRPTERSDHAPRPKPRRRRAPALRPSQCRATGRADQPSCASARYLRQEPTASTPSERGAEVDWWHTYRHFRGLQVPRHRAQWLRLPPVAGPPSASRAEPSPVPHRVRRLKRPAPRR